MTRFVKFMSPDGSAAGDEALAEALTSQHAHIRIVARAMASDWMEKMAGWLNDELERNPGARRVAILHAVAEIHASVFASAVAAMLRPDGDEKAFELYARTAARRLPDLVAMARRAREAGL